MVALRVENLNYKYGKKVVFEDVNFTVEKGSFLTIIGKGGCGKSTLFKILFGDYDFSGSVSFFNKSIKYNIEKGYVGYISLSIDYFKEKFVGDELIELLKSKGRSLDKIKLDLERIIKKLKIDYMLYSSINELTDKDKILLMFAYQLLNKPNVLILDNVLSYLDREYMIIMREIVRLNKKCTIINITNNTSECLFGNKVYILNKNEMLDVSTLSDHVFLDNGLRVPFMILISERLKSYNLIDKDYSKMEKLVDDLWK